VTTGHSSCGLQGITRYLLRVACRQWPLTAGLSRITRCRLNERDSHWYPCLIPSRLRSERWWVPPPGTIRWQPVRSVLARPSVKRFLLLPLLLALDLVEVYAAWQANRAFKKQRELAIWRRGTDG